MEVILLEKVANLGQLGDTVTIKSGYGRNYLIPKNKAIPATDENLRVFEQRRAELEQKAAQALQQAQARAERLNALAAIRIAAMASDEGKLYGSVGVQEITNAITEAGCPVEKREVLLSNGPIHEVGECLIQVRVHTDVIAEVTLVVSAAKKTSA
ncbi:MAG: 50S ribosomal protein L9 [Legionellales bacterium]|nr:50S ribosomal protein L9 [Legionellales bacterium]